jgi:hypothetical protein
MSIVGANKETFEEQAQALLDRLAIVAKKRRLARNLSQQEAGFGAGVSIKIVQAIEGAKNCQGLNLMTYLAFLGILESFMNTLPDPSQLTPIEQTARTQKVVTEIKKARVSRDRASTRQGASLIASKKPLPWKE